MADLNDKLAQAADSEVHRSSWQATNPDFGMNKAAVGTMTGGALPQQPQTGMPNPQAAMGAQDPLEMLKMSSTPSQEPLSLDSITEAQKEKIMKSFRECRNIANTQYTEVVEPRILHRRDVYQGTAEYYDKKFPILSQTSRWVSKDVKTSCNWILTGMMEAFCGTDAPLSVKGVNVDDDEIASKVQELVRYQLEKKNDWYHFCQAALRCALSENFAVAKVWWKHEEKRVKMEFLLDLQNLEQIIGLMEGAGTGKIQNLEFAELGDGVDDLVKCTYEEVKVTANHPVIEYVPSSELRYTPDAPNLQDCKFVAHRKIVRGSYLKQREMDGVYKNIDKALEEYDPGDTSSTMLDRSNDVDRADSFKRPSDEDNASKEVELYEAYLQVDWNNDGIYENVIVHAVGDEPIRISENDYGFPPFFICSAEYDPNAVFNRDSSTDMLEQQQDLKTAVMRQIITNVAKNNAPRVFVNERMVDMDALLEGDEIIPTQGDPGTAVLTPPSLPLAGLTMDVINYAQNEIESQSGSTRYNQGLDSNSLNQTATGVTAILGMAEKRNKMVARSIAERFFIPIYKFVILLNQKYLEDEQMIRLTNKTLSIRKEDLDIDYDLIVNVGQGAGTREAQIQYLMLVLNQIYPQLASQGIVNAKSWYNLVVKLLEALGLRDVSQYLLDPESPEAQQQAMAAQQAAAQAQAEALQNSLQLAIAKSSVPRVNLSLENLPPDAQRQYLKEKLGIDTTERAIAEHEVLIKND